MDPKQWTLKTKDKRYDSSIRALPFFSSKKKNTICVPGYFESQKQKIKERAGFPAKLNRRGQLEDSCQFQENTEKEGAPTTAEINVDLNFDRSDIPDSFNTAMMELIRMKSIP